MVVSAYFIVQLWLCLKYLHLKAGSLEIRLCSDENNDCDADNDISLFTVQVWTERDLTSKGRPSNGNLSRFVKIKYVWRWTPLIWSLSIIADERSLVNRNLEGSYVGPSQTWKNKSHPQLMISYKKLCYVWPIHKQKWVVHVAKKDCS